MNSLPRPAQYFADKLIDLGRQVRGAVVTARAKGAQFAGVSRQSSADTIYELDAHVEPVIEEFCAAWAQEIPLVLVAEGIGEGDHEGRMVFPRGTREADAVIRVLCDPVDGTRELMYDKRAAWFLAGVAPNRMEGERDLTRLSDIAAAVQVEIPVSKQTASDVLWATRGGGAHAVRDVLGYRAAEITATHPLLIQPSQAENITHGFATISNFFPGTKELSSRLMERIAEACLGAADVHKAWVFDDQYISTGGQFYELIIGHDRINADLRPIFYRIRGLPTGLSVHPYDLASVLIAAEAGVEVTDGLGGPLDGPLDVETSLSWAAFANRKLREKIEPIMVTALREWLNS